MQIEVDAALLATVVREEIDRRAAAGDRELGDSWALAASGAYSSSSRHTELLRVDRELFGRLGFEALLRRSVERAPGVAHGASKVIFAPTTSAASEAADLVDPERAVVGCRVRPARFATPELFERWLDHELAHAEDLLDPAFGFDAGVPSERSSLGWGAGVPSERSSLGWGGARGRQELPDALVARRYRALWCASVDGRLARRNRRGEPVEPLHGEAWHARNLAGTFPAMGSDATACARSAWQGPAASHADLLRVASAVRSRCPLCRFPAYPECPPANDLDDAAVARVRALAPGWGPSDGLCDRCREHFHVGPHAHA